MKNDEWRDKPIELHILPHTGKVDGDDTGYRGLQVYENCDPMVVVPPKLIRQELVYAKGPVTGLCPYYEKGLGAKPVALVRKPVLGLLILLDTILRNFGYGVLLVDGWRSSKTQIALWKYLFVQKAYKIGFRIRTDLEVKDILALGDAADKIGSYNAAENNEQLMLAVVRELHGPRRDDIHMLAEKRKEGPQFTAAQLVTYEANLEWRNDVTLSETATTAHGNGGATDLYMFGHTNPNPVCLGVPFDYPGEASRMDFFEREENFGRFQEEVRRDPLLKQYLTECGFPDPSDHDCRTFARNRRILYHAATSLGATIYVEEPWHFNWPCMHGILPESGNGCQAILKDASAAVWGNEFANEEARKLLRRYKNRTSSKTSTSET